MAFSSLQLRAIGLAASGVSPDQIRDTVASLLATGSDVTAAEVIGQIEHIRGTAPADKHEALASWLADADAGVVLPEHPGYPPHLLPIWPELGAPAWLFVRAPSDGLPTGPAVAIVGSRRPTLEGRSVAREL